MGYALRRSRLLVWSWQLCRGMSGNFRVEPVAILPWNQWQFLHGISGNFQMESVATFAWNTQALDGRFIGGTPIDGDLLWHAVATDRLGQKAFRGLLFALLRQEEINGLALLIHRTVEIPPLALHLDIRLIHTPAKPDLPFAAMECLFEEGTILDDPPVDGRVIHLHPTFFHEFLDMACAQRIRHIPPHPHENDLCGAMGTLKTDRHR